MMDDRNAFERQLAREIGRMAGPEPRFDALAIARSVVTARKAGRWPAARLNGATSFIPMQGRFTMFSALKFVAAGAIVALFGGLLLGGVQPSPQGEEVLPAAAPQTPDRVEQGAATHVTGTMSADRNESPGTLSWEAGYLRDAISERDMEWSDPRLPSSMRLGTNWDFYYTDEVAGISGAISMIQNVVLEGPDGAWTGNAYGLLEAIEPEAYPQTVLMVLEGEGAYEGLSAMLRTTYEEPPAYGEVPDWEGWIFEGEMTPVPEVPERTAA